MNDDDSPLLKKKRGARPDQPRDPATGRFLRRPGQPISEREIRRRWLHMMYRDPSTLRPGDYRRPRAEARGYLRPGQYSVEHPRVTKLREESERQWREIRTTRLNPKEWDEDKFAEYGEYVFHLKRAVQRELKTDAQPAEVKVHYPPHAVKRPDWMFRIEAKWIMDNGQLTMKDPAEPGAGEEDEGVGSRGPGAGELGPLREAFSDQPPRPRAEAPWQFTSTKEGSFSGPREFKIVGVVDPGDFQTRPFFREIEVSFVTRQKIPGALWEKNGELVSKWDFCVPLNEWKAVDGTSTKKGSSFLSPRSGQPHKAQPESSSAGCGSQYFCLEPAERAAEAPVPGKRSNFGPLPDGRGSAVPGPRLPAPDPSFSPLPDGRGSAVPGPLLPAPGPSLSPLPDGRGSAVSGPRLPAPGPSSGSLLDLLHKFIPPPRWWRGYCSPFKVPYSLWYAKGPLPEWTHKTLYNRLRTEWPWMPEGPLRDRMKLVRRSYWASRKDHFTRQGERVNGEWVVRQRTAPPETTGARDEKGRWRKPYTSRHLLKRRQMKAIPRPKTPLCVGPVKANPNGKPVWIHLTAETRGKFTPIYMTEKGLRGPGPWPKWKRRRVFTIPPRRGRRRQVEERAVYLRYLCARPSLKIAPLNPKSRQYRVEARLIPVGENIHLAELFEFDAELQRALRSNYSRKFRNMEKTTRVRDRDKVRSAKRAIE
jgi:hypothetical protein